MVTINGGTIRASSPSNTIPLGRVAFRSGGDDLTADDLNGSGPKRTLAESVVDKNVH